MIEKKQFKSESSVLGKSNKLLTSIQNNTFAQLQFIRFLLVGFINTFIGYGIYFICCRLLLLDYKISWAIALIIGSSISFILNRKFTFNSADTTVKIKIKFIFICVVYYFLNVFFTKYAMYMFDFSQELAGFVSLCICTVLNFLMQKFIVFRKQ